MTVPAKQLAARFRSWPKSQVPVNDAPWPILEKLPSRAVDGFVAVDCLGRPNLLVAGLEPSVGVPFLTHGLRLENTSAVTFVLDGRTQVRPAVVLTLLAPDLLDAFCALCFDVIDRIQMAGGDSSSVIVAIEEWRGLFMNGPRLAPAIELGLWGELWVISNSTIPDALVKGWRGPERGTVDFFVSGVALEVKTTRHPGVHHVSHGQCQADFGQAFMLSIACEEGSSGCSCGDLIASIAGRLISASSFYGALSRGKVNASLFESADRRYSLLSRPLVYSSSTIPRVRSFDPGVSDLRYKVSLDSSTALGGSDLQKVLDSFGLQKSGIAKMGP